MDLPAWPVTQGIPFADNTLRCGTPVRVVDAEGRVLPSQSRCLATWREDRQFVKWLLVDFQADIRAGRSSDVFIEHGPGLKPGPPPRAPSHLGSSAHHVIVDASLASLRLAYQLPGSGWR